MATDMPAAKRNLFDLHPAPATVKHVAADSPDRVEAENFIRRVFSKHFGAEVSTFAPNLLLLEQNSQIVAAAGWRSAASSRLFLESYLDEPIEHAMASLANQAVQRDRIVEVGNLAAEKNGSSISVILELAEYLDRFGHEWVVFTATSELIGIFSRLGLPLLALVPADPSRLGEAANSWGRYYDTQPIVVAGKIRLALEKVCNKA
jgi:hypothetical protein